MIEKLQARKIAVESEQVALEAEFKRLKEQGADINRKVSAIQSRFDGNTRVLNELKELMEVKPDIEGSEPRSEA